MLDVPSPKSHTHKASSRFPEKEKPTSVPLHDRVSDNNVAEISAEDSK